MMLIYNINYKIEKLEFSTYKENMLIESEFPLMRKSLNTFFM